MLEYPTTITNQSWGKEVVPLVSISCITYNHRNYIRDAIEGFLMQKTTFPLEILIHDDASPDGTANIIREYEAKYPDLIKPIYQTENQYSKHGGTIGRIQRGRAMGKYYAACEGDDFWTDPNKLQKQVEFLEANPDYSMCVHNSIIHYEGGESPDTFFNSASQTPVIGTEDLIEKWSFATASIVCRRYMMRDFEESSYLKKVYNGDYYLALMLSLKGHIRYMPEVMSVYRRDNLERYKGKELFFIDKRIELLHEFDEISQGAHHELITQKIKELKRSRRLQEIYARAPLIKSVYRGVKRALKL